MLGEGRRTGAAVARVTAAAKSQGVYARLCSRARWSADALLARLWALLLGALPWPRDEQGRLESGRPLAADNGGPTRPRHPHGVSTWLRAAFLATTSALYLFLGSPFVSRTNKEVHTSLIPLRALLEIK
jgi:hypothetical protein